MSLKVDAVPIPAAVRESHEARGGGELEMYSVVRPGGFLRLTVAEEPASTEGELVMHISVSFTQGSQADAPLTRRPNDKELREVRAHFAFIGPLDEDNSDSNAGGLVRNLWGEGK